MATPSLEISDDISNELQFEYWWKEFVAYHDRLKGVTWKVWKAWKGTWPDKLFDLFWDHIQRSHRTPDLAFFMEMQEYREQEANRETTYNQQELVRIYQKYLVKDSNYAIDIQDKTRAATDEFIEDREEEKWFMRYFDDERAPRVMSTKTWYVLSDDCPDGVVAKESFWNTAFQEIESKLKTMWTAFQGTDGYKDLIRRKKERICLALPRLPSCQAVIQPFTTKLSFRTWHEAFDAYHEKRKTDKWKFWRAIGDSDWSDRICGLLMWYAETEFSTENVWFMLEMGDYRLHSADSGFTEAKKQKKLVEIYKEYVKTGTAKEVNLSAKDRRDLTAAAAGEDEDRWFTLRDGVTAMTTVDDVWSAADKTVMRNLRDTWTRFQRSAAFQEFILTNRKALCKLFPDVSVCPRATGAHFGYHNPLHQWNAFNGIQSHSLSFGGHDSAHHHHHHDRVDYADSHPYADYEAVYSHPSGLVSDNSGDHLEKYLVGGVFGGVAIVFILVVFCIGLAFGMGSCWTYMQQKVLYAKGKERGVYGKPDDEENNSHL